MLVFAHKPGEKINMSTSTFVLSFFQVGFIGNVCLPCYQLLSVVILETEEMVKRAEENLGKWKKLAENKQEETSTC